MRARRHRRAENHTRRRNATRHTKAKKVRDKHVKHGGHGYRTVNAPHPW